MPGSRHSVLLVEDSTTMRDFVTATLEESGRFQVTSAHSGFHALSILPRSRYDLIITDINMPDINGLELVRFIRESAQHGKTPLLIISTDGRDVDRDRGMKLGANGYLTKPFAPDELLAAIDLLLGLPATSSPTPKP